MKRRLIVLLLSLILIVMGTSAQTDETLIWSLVGGDISTLNPALATDGNSINVINALFEGLFRVNPDTGLPEPGLTSWTISEDGLQYTFTIREDAQWSDGTPVTAADVKFTYDAILSDLVESPRKADIGTIASIEVIDEQTFVASLEAPNCTIWGSAFVNLTPLPSHMFEADFSDFMTSPFNTAPSVTSGPYLFDERSSGEFVRLVANPNYFDGQPIIENLLYRIVADPATLNQALQTGTVDYGFMYPDQLEQLFQREMFNVFVYPLNNSPIVIMNHQDPSNLQNAYDADGNLNELVPNPFFGDVRVRQAIAMGYDKSMLAMTLGPDAGSVPLSGPIVPAFYDAYDMSDIEPWEFNPERAAELLAEAGWEMGSDGVLVKDGLRFEVDLVYSKLVDLWGNAALIMQDQLSDLGIRLNIIEQEWSAYLGNVLLPGEFNITIVGFGGGTEIDGIAYNLLHSSNLILGGGGFNLAGYINPEMDDLLDRARTLPGCDVNERAELYREVQRIARDDVAYEWLVSSSSVNVLNARIEDAFIGQWSGVPNWEVVGWGIGQ